MANGPGGMKSGCGTRTRAPFSSPVEVVRHLLARGYRSAAFFGGPRDSPVMRDRRDTALAALEGAGLTPKADVHGGFNVQVTPLWQGEEEVASLMGRFNDACATYDGPRPRIMLLHHTYVARDAEDAEQGARELTRFYNYFGAWFQNKRPVRQGRIQSLSEAEMAANKMIQLDAIRRDLVIGTARQVIDRLKRVEDMGYDEFSFWIDSGMSAERKRASLARFIDDVMPAFG